MIQITFVSRVPLPGTCPSLWFVLWEEPLLGFCALCGSFAELDPDSGWCDYCG